MTRRLFALLLWEAAIVGAIVVVGRLPLPTGAWHDDPTLPLFAVVRFAAMTWLAVLGVRTTACLGAAALGLSGRVMSTLARGLPGPIARAALATAGLALTVPIAPAGAEGAAPVMRKLPDEPPTTAPAPSAPPPPAATVAPPADTPPAPPREHVVRPGENLWVIAERLATESRGGDVTDAEVLPVWRRLIAANADRVADPNHIHPGDILMLPT